MVCITNYMHIIPYQNAALEEIIQLNKKGSCCHTKICYKPAEKKRVNKVGYLVLLRQAETL